MPEAQAFSAQVFSLPGLRVCARQLGLMRAEHVLFSGLDLTIEPGRLVLLKGPNGSGKTTLLRALAGLVRAASGRCGLQIAGDWLDSEDAATLIHYQGHRDGLTPSGSLRTQLQFYADFLGAPARAVDRVAEQAGLTRALEVAGRGLSAGQKRRAALARLLLMPRPVWLLDEPQSALDAQGKDWLAAMLADHRARGGLVLAAIHDPLAVQADADITLPSGGPHV